MKFISHTRHYMPNVNLKTYNIMRLSVVLCMLSLFYASAKNGLLSSSGNIIEPAQCNDLGGARRDQTTKRILFLVQE